jgi:integrase
LRGRQCCRAGSQQTGWTGPGASPTVQPAAKVKTPDSKDGRIHLPCRGDHEHTPACRLYGFHDLRRAFATVNAKKLTPDALQALMGQKSYQTTKVYIKMARQMDAAVARLHRPDELRAANG